MRLCLDRTVAPRRSVELALPSINSAADILGAIKAVADAVGRGGITPGEGFALRSRRAAKILVAERRYNQSGF